MDRRLAAQLVQENSVGYLNILVQGRKLHALIVRTENIDGEVMICDRAKNCMEAVLKSCKEIKGYVFGNFGDDYPMTGLGVEQFLSDVIEIGDDSAAIFAANGQVAYFELFLLLIKETATHNMVTH